MKLYHATDKDNEKSIDKNGLIPFSGFYSKDGKPLTIPGCSFIYFTPDLEHAKNYGGVVYEVESNSLDQTKLDKYCEGICDIYKTDDYWNYSAPIHPSLLKKC